jgi:hypothetical protein
MTLYTEDELTQAYVAGKTGKPLPKPQGVELIEVTKLQGHEYEGLFLRRDK